MVGETRASDDALDLFCELLRGLTARVERRGRSQRLDAIADLDAGAMRLSDAVAVLLDASLAGTNAFGSLSVAPALAGEEDAVGVVLE